MQWKENGLYAERTDAALVAGIIPKKRAIIRKSAPVRITDRRRRELSREVFRGVG